MLDFLRPSCWRETKCQEELHSVCGLNSLVSFLIIFCVLWLFEGVDVFEILPAFNSLLMDQSKFSNISNLEFCF